MPFSVRADRRLIRTNGRSRRFIRVEITAPEAPRRADRIPVNLAFVIDRSGSMAGDKIRKAREAAIQGIRALRPDDRFAVVAYDDHVDVVVPSSLATPEARRRPKRGSPASAIAAARTCTRAGSPGARRWAGRCATTPWAAACC